MDIATNYPYDFCSELQICTGGGGGGGGEDNRTTISATYEQMDHVGTVC